MTILNQYTGIQYIFRDCHFSTNCVNNTYSQILEALSSWISWYLVKILSQCDLLLMKSQKMYSILYWCNKIVSTHLVEMYVTNWTVSKHPSTVEQVAIARFKPHHFLPLYLDWSWYCMFDNVDMWKIFIYCMLMQ